MEQDMDPFVIKFRTLELLRACNPVVLCVTVATEHGKDRQKYRRISSRNPRVRKNDKSGRHEI
jgi:hypothetical protein